MKSDRKLLIAILVLIGLVIWLITLSLSRSNDIIKMNQTIEELQKKVNQTSSQAPRPLNGHTPVLGVDYFNGSNGLSITGPKGDSVTGPIGQTGAMGSKGESAYDIAVKNGFSGSVQDWLESLKVKGEKGNPASELQIDCRDGRIVKKYTVDVFWEVTNIKCEVVDE